jgi:hypothetical protein
VWYQKSREKIQTTVIGINPFKIAVLDENHTSEILEVLATRMNSLVITKDEEWFEFIYEYNSTTGSLSFHIIKVEKVESKILKYHTSFVFHYEFPSYRTFFDDLAPLNEVLRFFNQEINARNYYELLTRSLFKRFHYDVWDRKKCRFHSSFSDANFGYLGMNNDFYQNPSKLFSFNETTMDFYLSFTTNGREHFIPRHIDFIIELIYIFDVTDVDINH